ncbi:MAG: DUF4340 domain-containing protein, partial [Caldilineaceae bacterium]
MFKYKTLSVAVLALLLVVQVGIIALLYGPQVLGRSADDEATTAAPLLPALDPATIERLSLQGDDDTLSLSRDGSDGWVLPDAGNYPVLAATVTQLISDVIALDTSRLVATTAASHARLRVDDANPIRRVDLGLSSGLTETVFIGSSPNARATHVRRAGSNDVYLARDLDTTDLRMDASGWVDTTFLTLEPSTVQALTLENDNGSFALQRDAAGGWSLNGLAVGGVAGAQQQFNGFAIGEGQSHSGLRSSKSPGRLWLTPQWAQHGQGGKRVQPRVHGGRKHLL